MGQAASVNDVQEEVRYFYDSGGSDGDFDTSLVQTMTINNTPNSRIMKPRIKFLILFILSFPTMLAAQNTVTGVVEDSKSGKPVQYANASLLRQSDSVLVSHTSADDKGVIRLQGVPDGDYRLVVFFIGYGNLERQVSVGGDVDLGTLALEPGTATIGEVVVKGERPLFAVDGEKSYYNSAEDPTVQTGTASDVLQNTPGVSVDVEGNVTLRGTAGVEIWINDKPSHMTSENLKTYLQQTPASSIDHIEVITNPSARYGSKADGIINIVTTTKVKRNQFFSFGANASIKPYASPWFSYVWSNDRLSLNLYTNFSYYHSKNNFFYDLSIYDPKGEERELVSFETDTSRSKSNNYSGGIYFSLDYEIDSMNTMSFWAGGWPGLNVNDNSDILEREMFLTHSTTRYSSESRQKGRNFWGGLGLYFMHSFDKKGHNISADINFSTMDIYHTGLARKHFTSPANYLRVKNSVNKIMNVDFSGEVTYNRPYSENGEISAGYYGGVALNSTLSHLDTLREGVLVTDEIRSFLHRSPSVENQIFFTLQHKFGNFTIKPGVRLEHEYISLTYPNVPTDTFNIRRHFFHVRPSLHLSYRTESMHNFRLSYSFRGTSPSADELTKFCTFDEDNFSSGNPYLKNVLTHSLETGWSKYWTKYGSVGLTLYFKAKSREINEINIPMYHYVFGREVSFSYPVNVGRSTNTGLEFNTMYRPNAMFNIRFYANVYHSYIETLYDNRLYKSGMWSYSFDLSIWAKLWKRLEISASGTYRSPSQSLFSQTHPYYGINAGLRADFFKNRLSVFLNVNDIFNWNRWGSDMSSPYLESHSTFKSNSRSVALGFTLRFGKMELEQQARQGAGNEGQGQGGM